MCAKHKHSKDVGLEQNKTVNIQRDGANVQVYSTVGPVQEGQFTRNSCAARSLKSHINHLESSHKPQCRARRPPPPSHSTGRLLNNGGLISRRGRRFRAANDNKTVLGRWGGRSWYGSQKQGKPPCGIIHSFPVRLGFFTAVCHRAAQTQQHTPAARSQPQLPVEGVLGWWYWPRWHSRHTAAGNTHADTNENRQIRLICTCHNTKSTNLHPREKSRLVSVTPWWG